MPDVTFGLAIGASARGIPSGSEMAALARHVEDVGFDSLEVGDHVQWYAPIHEATVLMATFAAATRRVRIASDVIILPLRDPVWMAKTIASLDVLSGGRVVFGVGVGGDNPAEYAAMRIPMSERGSRADESLEIIRGLFEHERFSYTGRHFIIEDVAIAPRPLQARLPVWVGGTSERPLRRAARFADGWISAFASERKFRRLAGQLRDLLADCGRSADGFTFGTFLFVHLDDDAARARKAAIHHVDEVYHLDGEAMVTRFSVAGPVDACVERVHRYLEAGADHIVLYPLCDPADWAHQVAQLGEVIARVKGGR
jgi:probable F420-dependent oxidoreductase